MNRILVICAMFSALVGVLAPIAGASNLPIRPDDRAGLIGVGAVQAQPAPPDAFERAVLRSTVENRRPDDRADARGPGAFTTASPVAAPSAEDGFAWNDALLGAAAMFGILLLGAAGTLAIRHRERVALR